MLLECVRFVVVNISCELNDGEHLACAKIDALCNYKVISEVLVAVVEREQVLCAKFFESVKF